MRRWLKLSSYSAFSLFVAMGLCAILFAWNTFDLARLAMANADFISEHGVMALRDGGLLQFLVIAIRSLVSMAAYLGFKATETELIDRWRAK